jgi:hypothetical protein
MSVLGLILCLAGPDTSDTLKYNVILREVFLKDKGTKILKEGNTQANAKIEESKKFPFANSRLFMQLWEEINAPERREN